MPIYILDVYIFYLRTSAHTHGHVYTMYIFMVIRICTHRRVRALFLKRNSAPVEFLMYVSAIRAYFCINALYTVVYYRHTSLELYTLTVNLSDVYTQHWSARVPYTYVVHEPPANATSSQTPTAQRHNRVWMLQSENLIFEFQIDVLLIVLVY